MMAVNYYKYETPQTNTTHRQCKGESTTKNRVSIYDSMVSICAITYFISICTVYVMLVAVTLGKLYYFLCEKIFLQSKLSKLLNNLKKHSDICGTPNITTVKEPCGDHE